MGLWKDDPYGHYLKTMAERAVRFAPHRIEPVMDVDAMLEREECRRTPLTHAPDKPIEDMLAEDMDFYSVPF